MVRWKIRTAIATVAEAAASTIARIASAALVGWRRERLGA